MLVLGSALLVGCGTPPDTVPGDAPGQRAAITDADRLADYRQHWQSVRQRVAYQAVAHQDAFYGSRAYWHTGSAHGLSWAFDHGADLTEPVYIDGRGNVRIAGDADADIEVSGDAIVHILGDLNATLELKGVCEVVVAGEVAERAMIVCDGSLELFVGGGMSGMVGATGGSTIVIEGNATGVIQCGAPASRVTIAGDLGAQVAAPKGKDAILHLRVDGYCATRTMLDINTAGFTRVNAALGESDAPAGLYPSGPNASSRPTARWVVLRQRALPDDQ